MGRAEREACQRAGQPTRVRGPHPASSNNTLGLCQDSIRDLKVPNLDLLGRQVELEAEELQGRVVQQGDNHGGLKEKIRELLFFLPPR